MRERELLTDTGMPHTSNSCILGNRECTAASLLIIW